MQTILSLFDKLPNAISFIQECRGLIEDLQEVYKLRQADRATTTSQATKDTTNVENLFKQQQQNQPAGPNEPNPPAAG